MFSFLAVLQTDCGKYWLTSANDVRWQETHLQKALTAQQFYGTAEARAIPIPEVQSVDERYSKLYTPDFKLPKQYIHIQGWYEITNKPFTDQLPPQPKFCQ